MTSPVNLRITPQFLMDFQLYHSIAILSSKIVASDLRPRPEHVNSGLPVYCRLYSAIKPISIRISIEHGKFKPTQSMLKTHKILQAYRPKQGLLAERQADHFRGQNYMSNKKPVTGTAVNVSLDVTVQIEIFTFFSAPFYS
jgi:hypothetical protein